MDEQIAISRIKQDNLNGLDFPVKSIYGSDMAATLVWMLSVRSTLEICVPLPISLISYSSCLG